MSFHDFVDCVGLCFLDLLMVLAWLSLFRLGPRLYQKGPSLSRVCISRCLLFHSFVYGASFFFMVCLWHWLVILSLVCDVVLASLLLCRWPVMKTSQRNRQGNEQPSQHNSKINEQQANTIAKPRQHHRQDKEKQAKAIDKTMHSQAKTIANTMKTRQSKCKHNENNAPPL